MTGSASPSSVPAPVHNVGGAVLAGGRSSRFGRDKALVEFDGRSMGAHVVEVLQRAGIDEVVVVGGSRDREAVLGAPVVADRFPGEGPLGGIITALSDDGPLGPALAPDAESGWGTAAEAEAGAHAGIVVVLACDLPRLDVGAVRAVVEALHADPEAGVAVPVVGGHRQVLAAAWRRSVRHLLEQAFDAGERSPTAALEGLAVVEVGLDHPNSLTDVDSPRDLRSLWRR